MVKSGFRISSKTNFYKTLKQEPYFLFILLFFNNQDRKEGDLFLQILNMIFKLSNKYFLFLITSCINLLYI